MAFCNQCGTELAPGAKFCPKCGAAQSVQQAPAAPAPAAQPQNAQQAAPAANQFNAYNPYQQAAPAANQFNAYNPYQQAAPQPVLKQKARIPATLRFIGIVGAILIAVSIFLPYVSVSVFGFKESLTLLDGDGDAYVFLGTAIVGLIFAATNLGIGQIIMGLLAILFQIIEWDNAHGSFYKKEIAYYFILFGAILLIIGGFVVAISKHNAKKALRANNLTVY